MKRRSRAANATMLREMRGDCTAGGSKTVAAFVE
jgi:hypothetical protein